MAIDKTTLNSLKRFATAFREARERGANESDTVMFVVKFLEEVLGYDSLKGEISKELAIKDRYCDIALKVEGTARVIVECKAASIKELAEKHIEQAENYASRAGITWVMLTNGVEWKLFHLTFGETEGIAHDIAFETNLVEQAESSPDVVWSKLSLLHRDAVAGNALDEYWAQKKALSPACVVRALFSQDVITTIRRELNRNAPARLDIEDVFNAIRDVISKEALLEVGDISITKTRKRRRRRKVTKTDEATGQTVTEEIEEDVPDSDQPDPATAPVSATPMTAANVSTAVPGAPPAGGLAPPSPPTSGSPARVAPS